MDDDGDGGEQKEKIDFNSVIGLVLRYGVLVSFATILFGCILLFAEGQTGYYPLTNTAAQLFDRRNRFLIGLAPLLQGVISLRPYAIIDLGLILLLGTPLARVAVSIPLFASEKRFAFVLMTATVLAILLLSMFVIAPLVSG